MKKTILITIASLIAFNVLGQEAEVAQVVVESTGSGDNILIGKVTAAIAVAVVAIEQFLPYLPTKFNSITQGVLQFLRRFLPKDSMVAKK